MTSEAVSAAYKRLWKDDPTASDDCGKWCFWCDVRVDDYDAPIPHLNGCPWRMIVAANQRQEAHADD